MRNEKIILKVILIASLIAATFTPINAFAQTFAEKKAATNDYSDLVQIIDLIQISDRCLNNKDSDNRSIINIDSTKAEKVSGLLNLETAQYFMETTTSVYSNYLDNENPKNGAAWCQDFARKTPFVVKDPIRQIVSSIDGDLTFNSIGNIICGKANNNTGLLSITFKYKKSSGDVWETLTEENADSLPDGVKFPSWVQVDSSGKPKDCKNVLKEIKALPDYYLGDRIMFNLFANRDFSFEDYYSEEIKIEGTTKANVDNERLYLDVTKKDNGENICYIRQVNKNTYDKLGEPKYAIKNPSGPANSDSSATEYWVPDSSKKANDGTLKFNSTGYGASSGGLDATNIRPNPTGSEFDHISCKQAMERLAEYSKTDAADATSITKCYNDAKDNRDTLYKIYTKLKTTSGTLSNQLIQVANYLVEGKEIPSYTDASGKHTPFLDNGAQIYNTIMNDGSLSKSASAKDFANLAKEFGNKIVAYNDEKTSNGSLSSAAISDLKNQISDYTSTRNTFKTSVVDKVGKSLNGIPKVNLNSMYKNGILQSEVKNFYKMDEEGNLTCIYNDKVEEVKKKIEEIIGASIDFKEYVQGQTKDDGSNSENGDSDPCYDAGIEGMSWVLCPTIHNTTETIDGMEGALKTMLSIESDKLFGNGNVSYSIWDTFRNIANALLIIIFLIIIFSQLTGYGIDNYGIKKVLPKLIIMAILINLSYIICELAVDLSNILGVGLSNLFEGIAKGAGNTDMPLGDIVTAILVAAAGAAAASGAVITVVSLVSGGGGVMLIITLVLALLSALVAILMFLVMVGARMVIVIVFTAISPVAFALYILPNTQNLFKKWWKVFEAALVVYPICGALYGAHYIVKAIIVGQGGEVNFFMAIAALIAPFLPFLVLPSLLRGALAGLGAVAGAITAAGSGLRRGFARGNSVIKSTDRYKDAQERAQDRRIQRRAGLDSAGKEIKMGRFRRFIRGGDRGISRARTQYVKNLEAKNRENAMMNGGFDAAMAGVEAKADAQRVSDIEALLANNKVPGVNINDAKSVGAYHSQAISNYQTATTEADKTAAMARIKAAQNILSKTESGRTEVQKNLENAARKDQGKGLSQVAAHLLSAYGDKYKSANRGTHGMITDMATAGDTNGDISTAALSRINSKIDEVDSNSGKIMAGSSGSDSYSMYGIDKYTEESLANADTEAISRLRDSITSGRMTDIDKLATIQGTARRALEKAESGNLYIKPEVRRELEKIRDHGTIFSRPIGFSG